MPRPLNERQSLEQELAELRVERGREAAEEAVEQRVELPPELLQRVRLSVDKLPLLLLPGTGNMVYLLSQRQGFKKGDSPKE